MKISVSKVDFQYYDNFTLVHTDSREIIIKFEKGKCAVIHEVFLKKGVAKTGGIFIPMHLRSSFNKRKVVPLDDPEVLAAFLGSQYPIFKLFQEYHWETGDIEPHKGPVTVRFIDNE